METFAIIMGAMFDGPYTFIWIVIVCVGSALIGANKACGGFEGSVDCLLNSDKLKDRKKLWLESDDYADLRKIVVEKAIKELKIKDPSTDESKKRINKHIYDDLTYKFISASISKYDVHACIALFIGVAAITYSNLVKG